MKGFKKLALVAAIAAPFTSVHALESLDDSVLSDMTGQAGVSIDLEARVSIDEVVYTDTAHAVGLDASGNPIFADGGQIAFGAIKFGGASVGTAGSTNEFLDDVKIDIDVTEGGDLKIHLGTQNLMAFLQGTQEVDFGLALGDSANGVAGMQLRGTNAAGDAVATNVLGDVSLSGVLGPIDIVISNDGAGTTSGLINATGYFAVDQGSVDIPVAGVGISNLKIYQNANAGKLGQAGVAQGGFAYFDVTVDTVDTVYNFANTAAGDLAAIGATRTDVAVSEALSLTVNSFNVDIDMDVAIGTSTATGALAGLVTSSIGNVHLENLDVSGTTLTVYGH